MQAKVFPLPFLLLVAACTSSPDSPDRHPERISIKVERQTFGSDGPSDTEGFLVGLRIEYANWIQPLMKFRVELGQWRAIQCVIVLRAEDGWTSESPLQITHTDLNTLGPIMIATEGFEISVRLNSGEGDASRLDLTIIFSHWDEPKDKETRFEGLQIESGKWLTLDLPSPIK